MRSKEESHDYRYFPDPDLPPLRIEKELIERLKEEMPELPDKKKKRFMEEYRIKEYDASILVSEKDTADFFEKLIPNRDIRLVISWVTGELFSYLKKKNITIRDRSISVDKIGELIDLIQNGVLSNRLAKELFEEYLNGDKSAKDLVSEKGMTQISNENQISDMIQKVLQTNPKMLDEYKNGKDKLFGFFIGQVMKISNGKANPKILNTLLKKKLKQDG